MATTYKVIAASGDTVNLRGEPSTTASIIKRIPIGSIVKGNSCAAEGWTAVEADGAHGYMMSKFLQKQDESSVIDELIKQVDELNKKIDLVEARVYALEGGVG